MVDKESLTKKFQKEMNAGIASLVLLCVMGQSTEAMYGYQIAKHLEENNQDMPEMKQGAQYPVLRSLEKSGLLDSEATTRSEATGRSQAARRGGDQFSFRSKFRADPALNQSI